MSMILIADAGATSIEWRMIGKDDAVSQYKTHGFNPYQQPIEDLIGAVREMKDQFALTELESFFYYGAGTASKKNQEVILNALKECIEAKQYEIMDDLLAAARALLIDQPGIAIILGTGTNSCFYDGKDISKVVPSLGFAMGDEGSGASLGKRLLKNYLRGDLPADLVQKFEKRFDLDEQQLLNSVYQGDTPAKFLASFSKFLSHNIAHPFIYKLVYDEFTLFCEEILLKYDEARTHTINFSGSVAFYYANILRQVITDHNLNAKTIVESPIAGLTLYHQKLNE